MVFKKATFPNFLTLFLNYGIKPGVTKSFWLGPNVRTALLPPPMRENVFSFFPPSSSRLEKRNWVAAAYFLPPSSTHNISPSPSKKYKKYGK